MKKIISILTLFFTLLTFAQVPQGISYQAIALNGSGNPVASSNVGVRLSVLDNSANGTVLYTETHTKITNPQGLFNLVIGQGTPTTGTFSAIDWRVNTKFLKVEMDAAGGSNYTLVGTTQLLSVPYAMHAGSVASIDGNPSINDDIINNKSSSFAFNDTVADRVYACNTVTNTWTFQQYNASASPSILNSNGNFGFNDIVDNIVYVYNSKTGTWSSQVYNSSASPTIQVSNGNFIFNDIVDDKIYVFNGKTGTWSFQSYNASASPSFIISNSNIGFNDIVDDKMYVFNGKTGTWSSQAYSSTASPTLQESNGNFVFNDTVSNIIYVFNGNANSWSQQLYDTSASPTVLISTTN